MTNSLAKPPLWYWVVCTVLLLWALAGLFAFYSEATMTADAVAAMPDYDRKLYQSLPGWLNIVYAVATIGGAAGAVALLLRARIAAALYALSTAAVVVQFGYVVGLTDLVAVKGFVGGAAFPLFVVVMGVVAFLIARMAAARGWLG
ncbi:MAG: hypothetical protein H2054_04415 [Sphingomonas sp.]|uniref:hypothetical protein n=1 Tax=Sphingomonas sp. TaxID=28214 RepID=UPI000DB1C1BA|nr:hypothetical protein [Zymomonas sp.]MBA4772337.1 hypothetical protein [Sphingomonas sp.]PZP11375.1 MAG: hypothetical protein DI607_10770 [Sphingomonas hengshuiensis]